MKTFKEQLEAVKACEPAQDWALGQTSDITAWRLIEGYQGPQVPALLVIRENLEKFISENIELTTEENFLLNHDKRILAIKSVRGRTGLGLRWSKAAVDRCDLEKIRREPHPCEIFRPPTVV